MKMHIAGLLAAFALVLVLAGGCGDEDEATPTCRAAADNAYAVGCIIMNEAGTAPLSKQEFYNQCLQQTVAASQQGGNCPSAANALLSCLSSVGKGQCETCNDELGRFKGCQ
jgi:hypothetical protein